MLIFFLSSLFFSYLRCCFFLSSFFLEVAAFALNTPASLYIRPQCCWSQERRTFRSVLFKRTPEPQKARPILGFSCKAFVTVVLGFYIDSRIQMYRDPMKIDGICSCLFPKSRGATRETGGLDPSPTWIASTLRFLKSQLRGACSGEDTLAKLWDMGRAGETRPPSDATLRLARPPTPRPDAGLRPNFGTPPQKKNK